MLIIIIFDCFSDPVKTEFPSCCMTMNRTSCGERPTLNAETSKTKTLASAPTGPGTSYGVSMQVNGS